MLPKNSQLAPYLEAAQRKRGNQSREPGYNGIGYWWTQYPAYLATQATVGNPQIYVEGQTGAPLSDDSKLAGAAEEAGAVTSGTNQGASGAGLMGNTLGL